MKIFLSWSGRRSQAIAESLRTWLRMLLQAVDPWTSSEDIRRGKRWGIEIAESLSETNFGIVCLTPENVNEKWILFEAGALAKNLAEARVCTYLLQLKPTDLEAPLADFQATMADEQGSFKLVQEINQHLLPDRRLDPESLRRLFNLLWPALKESLSDAASISLDRPPHAQRTDRELLEEILETVRQTPPLVAGDREGDLALFTEANVRDPKKETVGNEFPDMQAGCFVHHPSFGKGKIVDRFAHDGRIGATIDFENAGRKRIILNVARLRLLATDGTER